MQALRAYNLPILLKEGQQNQRGWIGEREGEKVRGVSWGKSCRDGKDFCLYVEIRSHWKIFSLVFHIKMLLRLCEGGRRGLQLR